MNLPHIELKLCQCGHPVCKTYGLNIGQFYQGCGFSEAEAKEIARRCNAFDELLETLKGAATWVDLSDPDGAQAKIDFERIVAKYSAPRTENLA